MHASLSYKKAASIKIKVTLKLGYFFLRADILLSVLHIFKNLEKFWKNNYIIQDVSLGGKKNPTKGMAVSNPSTALSQL